MQAQVGSVRNAELDIDINQSVVPESRSGVPSILKLSRGLDRW